MVRVFGVVALSTKDVVMIGGLAVVAVAFTSTGLVPAAMLKVAKLAVLYATDGSTESFEQMIAPFAVCNGAVLLSSADKAA